MFNPLMRPKIKSPAFLKGDFFFQIDESKLFYFVKTGTDSASYKLPENLEYNDVKRFLFLLSIDSFSEIELTL